MGSPKFSCAICGNSARGIPKTIAMTSTTKLMSSTGCVRRYARPSTTERNPGVARPGPSTGSRGSRITAHSVASRQNESMR